MYSRFVFVRLPRIGACDSRAPIRAATGAKIAPAMGRKGGCEGLASTSASLHGGGLEDHYYCHY